MGAGTANGAAQGDICRVNAVVHLDCDSDYLKILKG